MIILNSCILLVSRAGLDLAFPMKNSGRVPADELTTLFIIQELVQKSQGDVLHALDALIEVVQ